MGLDDGDDFLLKSFILLTRSKILLKSLLKITS